MSKGHLSGRTHIFISSMACITSELKLSTLLPWVPSFRTLQRFEQSFARSTKSCSFIILSCPSFNSSVQYRSLEPLTHPNQRKESDCGPEDPLDRQDLRCVFCDVQDAYGSVQRRNVPRSISRGSRLRLEHASKHLALTVGVEGGLSGRWDQSCIGGKRLWRYLVNTPSDKAYEDGRIVNKPKLGGYQGGHSNMKRHAFVNVLADVITATGGRLLDVRFGGSRAKLNSSQRYLVSTRSALPCWFLT